jgi:hypothetical protein
MTEWIGLIVDSVLIVVVAAGVVQAIRLIRQLRDLRAGRIEMERFVRDFNGAVNRAEAGIKALRSAARDSGDDLEKLVEKALLVRDELNFIVESADGLAERLTSTASKVITDGPAKEAPAANVSVLSSAKGDGSEKERRSSSGKPVTPNATTREVSRAEQELIQALKKLG